MCHSLPPEKAFVPWPSTKAKQVLAGLLRLGWTIKRQSGTSHRILQRHGWPDFLFAYHDRVTLGPTAMKVLAKKTGLRREDL
jgi:predicted RNA binding protein YcfA (HicA-like mRNA interferase family)